MTAVKIVILGFEPGLPGGTLQTPFYYKKWKWTSAGQTDTTFIAVMNHYPEGSGIKGLCMATPSGERGQGGLD